MGGFQAAGLVVKRGVLFIRVDGKERELLVSLLLGEKVEVDWELGV